METLTMEHPPPSSSAATPSIPMRNACFPTSSRSTPANSPPTATLPSRAHADAYYHKLGFAPSDESNTLAVPLALAHILWSPTCHEYDQPNKSDHQQSSASASGSHHRHHHHASSSFCSTQALEIRLDEPSLGLTKIGRAYERCFFELRHFLGWDANNWCFSLNESYQAHVDTKLRQFGFYEDATGTYQEKLVPKYSSFSTCKHGHHTPTSHGACRSANHHAKPAAKQATSKVTTSAGVESIASAAKPNTPAANNHHNTSAHAASTSTTQLAATNAAKKTSKPAASAAKPISSRDQQKKPAQTQSAKLLADCRKFPSFRESNKAKRAYLSPGAMLTDVIRELNRAVLRFGTDDIDSVLYAELAGIVALLNYAAALNIWFAEGIESYMQDRLGHKFVEVFFRAVYSNRADYIETEEWRSSGSADLKHVDPVERDKRLQAIENEFVKMVPDVTDLRDGVQTVLFTFMWINYTAYQGIEQATAATLHTIVPLLQTIVIRCARQTYLLHRALEVARSHGAFSKLLPGTQGIQLDLLELSAALQCLSGCDLALFTSSTPKNGGKILGKKMRRKKCAWNESVVYCPYTAHLYTSAVADITFRLLLQLAMVIEIGPRPNDSKESMGKQCREGCLCTKMVDRLAPVLEGLGKRLTLIEREQHDWKPKMVKPKKGRKKKGVGHAKASEGEEATSKGGKGLVLNELLRKKIEEFDELAGVVQTSRMIAHMSKMDVKIVKKDGLLSDKTEKDKVWEKDGNTLTATSNTSPTPVKSDMASKDSSISTTTSSNNSSLTSTPSTTAPSSIAEPTTTPTPSTTPHSSSSPAPPPQPLCPVTPNQASIVDRLKSGIQSLVNGHDLRALVEASFGTVAELEVYRPAIMHLPGVGDVPCPGTALEEMTHEEQQKWLVSSMVALMAQMIVRRSG